MKFQKNSLGISVASALLVLAGCGVTPQDEGLGSSGAAAVSGVAVDGYVARAVVYVDTNRNNKLDVWEARALTDGRGYFTYSPAAPAVTDVDGNVIVEAVAAISYCDLLADDSKYVHCLKIPAGYDEVLIRMTKGYDLSTSEPFTGTLSMQVKSNSGSLDSVMVGTPITGLMAEMTATQKAAFLDDENISGVEQADFLNFETSNALKDKDTERLTLLTLALKIHKVADAIAGRLDASLAQGTKDGFFGVEEGIPTDASVYVYQSIVARMASGDMTASALLASQSAMSGVVSDSWAAMIKVLNDYNIAKDETKFIAPADPSYFDALATNLVDLAGVVGTVFTGALVADGTYTDSKGNVKSYTLGDDAKARIRAIDIMASLIRGNAVAAAVDNAKTLATTDAAYLASLKSPKVDITGLKKKFTDNVGGVVAGDANYDARQSFGSLIKDNSSGAGFTGSDGGAVNDEGFASNTMEMSDNGDDTKIAFQGDTPDATSGTMTIDATFTEGDFAKKDENGEAVPLALEGTWEQLDEYTMLMNVEVAGVIEPVIVKPTITKDADGNDVSAYYFDLGGEQQVWIP